MKQMRTNNTKRSKRGIVAILSIVLVLLTVLLMSLPAMAASYYAIFSPYIAGTANVYENVYTSRLSATSSINFKNDGIFYTPSNSYIYYTRAFKIVSEDMGSNTALRLKVDKGPNDTSWDVKESPGRTVIIYRTRTTARSSRVLSTT